MNRVVLLVFALLLGGCATPGEVGVAERQVWVISNGFHSGIVVAVDDLPEGVLPEVAVLAGARYVEIGWGDHIYYPMQDPPWWQALRAVLLPGPSVLHLTGHRAWPPAYTGVEVLALAVSEQGFDAMLARMDASFVREGTALSAVFAPGLDDASVFYPAHGRFHLFSNCNTWVARKLAAAGVPVTSFGVMSAWDLMRRLRPHAQAGADD